MKLNRKYVIYQNGKNAGLVEYIDKADAESMVDYLRRQHPGRRYAIHTKMTLSKDEIGSYYKGFL